MTRAIVVVPTFKERDNVGRLVERLSSVRDSIKPVDLRVLFVDDNSPDGTADEIKRSMAVHDFVHLLQRKEKLGLGTAYKAGFSFALGEFDPSVFVQMDSDLQHPPEIVPELVKAVMDGAGMALGSRYVAGGGVKGWSRRRKLLSNGANFFARSLLGLRARDLTSGFKAFSRRAVEALLEAKLSASGFSYQVESVKLVRDRGFELVEVPYVFEKRVEGSSKLSSREIADFLMTVVRLRFRHF